MKEAIIEVYRGLPIKLFVDGEEINFKTKEVEK
jgi:hypothetical protein